MSPVAAQSSRKSEVVVLSTLHTFHENSKYYSYDMLSRTIERLKPDVLAVELTAADLQSRKIQKVKQEYQHSIFPLADKRGYILVPLEPDPPKFGELVSLVQNSEKQLRDKYPQKAEAFSVYSDALYEYLFRSWKSVLDVNSSETDALFEVKHEFQNKLYGPDQKLGWDGWNEQFLEKTLAAAAKYPGKRIVVLVGVEHAYWLRKHLRQASNIRYLEPSKFLAKQR